MNEQSVDGANRYLENTCSKKGDPPSNLKSPPLPLSLGLFPRKCGRFGTSTAARASIAVANKSVDGTGADELHVVEVWRTLSKVFGPQCVTPIRK